MVCSSFNIQYQRTGIGPLSSLGKFGPTRQSVRMGWFIIQHGIFPNDGHIYFFWISDTLSLWWSVAPLIFNTKARGLAHCLLWVKLLGLDEAYMYGVYYHTTWHLRCIASVLFFWMQMKIEHLKIAMAAFQQQSRQHLVDEYKYKHMNSRNDSLDVRLNPL